MICQHVCQNLYAKDLVFQTLVIASVMLLTLAITKVFYYFILLVNSLLSGNCGCRLHLTYLLIKRKMYPRIFIVELFYLLFSPAHNVVLLILLWPCEPDVMSTVHLLGVMPSFSK